MFVFTARCPRVYDETVQSTSMIRNMSFALLAGAVSVSVSSISAFAFEDDIPADPRVIYAQQTSTPPMPIRVAYNERSNMGGGLIEALFGGGQSSDYQTPRYAAVSADAIARWSASDGSAVSV